MRYVFDLSGRLRAWDRIGIDLPDEHVARQEAIRFAGELIQSEPELLDDGMLRITVQGENSLVVFAIEITATTS